RLASEQVDGHALDGADVHERMFRLWRLEIGFRKHLGIELVAFLQVVPLKALAVYLVNLVELLARLRFKRGEGPNRLCGEYAPINKKEDSLPYARLEESIDFVDDCEGLPG